MKYLKMLGLAAVSAMALMAFASTASATTLEVNNVTTDKTHTISASLESGQSALLEDTAGFSENTCKQSSVIGHTVSPFTEPNNLPLTGTIDTLSFGECARTVTVHKPGHLEIAWISNTTNGTVYSQNAEVTSGSPFGHLNCKTVTTHLGTLTGVKSGKATLHVNAQLTCSGVSTRWTATYTITSPEGLGVKE